MHSLMTERQVSQQIQVSLAALRKWRVERRGPRFVKVGPLVRYRAGDLAEWMESLPTGGGPLSPHTARPDDN
jgi:predicted DNA-binding transcriptional regulator AlpA